MQLSADRFAAALASRLNAVVPTPVRVFVEGAVSASGRDPDITVRVAHESELWSGQVVSDRDLEPDDDESLLDVATGRAVTVLSGVQDSVCRILREPWPALPGGGMAMPDARTDQQRVYLWYGPAEGQAALTLRPIELTEVTRPLDSVGGQ